MSAPLIPIMKVHLATKSNRVLKAYLSDSIIRKNGVAYCTVKDILRGLAAIGEDNAYVDYWSEPTVPSFRVAGFGVVNTESKTVPLIADGRKLLNAPLEALKEPTLLVGKKFKHEGATYTCEITSIYTTGQSALYIAYGIARR